MIDIQITLPDGSITRIRKVSPVPTRRGAANYEREVRAALLEGTRSSKEDTQPAVPTLASFAAYFIDTYATTNNRPSTVREKRRTLGRGMLAELGRLRLDQIGPRQLEAFKARRKKDGVGNKTINEELAILSKILGYAEEIGELTTPPPKIRRLKVQKPSFDFLDFDEATRLEDAAREAPAPWRAMIPFALWSGLRLGELRALRWDDLDFVAGVLHVRRAVDDVGDLQPPKSGQARVVDLPQKAVDLLRGHRHEHQHGPYVFCHEDGAMLPRWHCVPKSTEPEDDSPLQEVARKAGLRRIGWHVLRHTYASHLTMLGAKPAEVQELLGHASLTMTMRYTHLSPSARRAAAKLLDAAPPRHHGGTENSPSF